MRDILHIGGLFLVFAFLVTRYPSELPSVSDDVRACPAFASFVTLSPAAYAARQEAARTSWQVRSQARGRPSIGQLDSDVPLLSESLPQPFVATFPPLSNVSAGVPAPGFDTYSFMPPTVGAEMPEFAVKKVRPDANRRMETPRQPPFDRNMMVSIEDYKTLKEIMR